MGWTAEKGRVRTSGIGSSWHVREHSTPSRRRRIPAWQATGRGRNPHPWGKSKRAAAFTLLELMIVIALIAVLSAIVVPEMKGTLKDTRLRAASRELVDVFALASSRAVSLGQVHRVHLDERTGRYMLERLVHEGRDGPEFEPVTDVPGSEGELDSRIAVLLRPPAEDESQSPAEASPTSPTSPTGSEAGGPLVEALTFYPDGTTDGGDIELRDEDGFCFVLRLNRITARVHVVELARE